MHYATHSVSPCLALVNAEAEYVACFAAAFDPTGANLLYSTLFGGLDFDCSNGCNGTYATGIAVDANGYFYLTRETSAAKLM